MSKDKEPTNEDLNKMIKDMGVSNEKELEKELLDHWDYVGKCPICGNRLKLSESIMCDDVLIHRNCN